MLFKVGDQIINPDVTPVALIFQDDAERERVAAQIASMAPKEGERWYAQVPSGMMADRAAFEAWATAGDAQSDSDEGQPVDRVYDLAAIDAAYEKVKASWQELNAAFRSIKIKK